MAKTNIKGKDVGLYVEKTAGSGTYTRINCIGSTTLTVTTEMDEVDCVESGNWKEVEPGQNSFEGSADLTARQFTDTAAVTGPPSVPASTDATDNVSLENLLDYQMQGRKIKMRFSLGDITTVGTARYEGGIYINKSDIKGQTKGTATGSIGFTGTGPLTKTLTTAP